MIGQNYGNLGGGNSDAGTVGLDQVGASTPDGTSGIDGSNVDQVTVATAGDSNQDGRIAAARSNQSGLLAEIQSHNITELITLTAEDLLYFLLDLVVLVCKIIGWILKEIFFNK
jgi:hypothetical protein